MMRLLLVILIWCGCAVAAWAQPANDECINAISLGDITTYCSSPAEFSNVGATTSPQGRSTCHFDTVGHDVWFSFVATAPNLSITLIGDLARSSGGTLRFPELAVYEASCAMPVEVACGTDAFEVNVVSTLYEDLVPGELYFVKIQARESREGTFQLCIDNYDFVPPPQSDCVDGVILCDKSSFSVANVNSAGSDRDEVDPSECIREELNSVWYRWTCDEPGNLTFTLTPKSPVDDLDFAIYELPGGIDDCANKTTIRCMASGANTNFPLSDWERCSGATGLREGDPNTFEDPGCDPGDNNFVRDFQMESGKAYALIINNFTQSGNGFSIEWGGTGTFVGPKPSFEIDPLSGSQCDDDPITFLSTSTLPPGQTGSYEWFFGNYASMPQAAGEGPHDITYGGFGDKVVSLRVTSSEGCVVTETRELFIGPCCDPANPLVASDPEGVDPTCPGTATGSLSVGIESGEPEYFFSLDGGVYLPDRLYEGLFAGDYTVYAQNIKGCLDTVEISLTDPAPITVEVGEDRSIEFGEIIEVDALVNTSETFNYVWSGADSIICLNADCSRVEVLASSPTQVEVVATNDAGCITSDLLQIEVRKVRPLYVPNAFSPNEDGSNDKWMLYGPANVITRVDKLQIFDRWGNLVFTGEDLPINRGDVGWDGTHRGRPLNPGVFAFYAEVRYIDGVVFPVTGDINLLR